ncbi:MAG: rhomboid family intramembrane serine protease [Planctomycetales bacterium]|nr:rhomboid family intramembrane serine protease [Planctomycetales bacterium]
MRAVIKQLWRDARFWLRQVPEPTVFSLILFMTIVFFVGEVFGHRFEAGNCVPQEIVIALDGFTLENDVSLLPLVTLLTATILHGDAGHLGSNMAVFWPFGCLASQSLGKWHVLWIFAVTGIVGNIAHVAMGPSSEIPLLGASGAVAGFEGVFVGLACRWRLRWPHVWPLAHPVSPRRLVVFAVVGVGLDAFRMASDDVSNVAFDAHVGGFISGFVIGLEWTFVRKRPLNA